MISDPTDAYAEGDWLDDFESDDSDPPIVVTAQLGDSGCWFHAAAMALIVFGPPIMGAALWAWGLIERMRYGLRVLP